MWEVSGSWAWAISWSTVASRASVRLHVAERLHDVLRAVTLGDELDQPADLVLRPLDALPALLRVGFRFRE